MRAGWMKSRGAYWGLSDCTNILRTETSSPIKNEVSKKSQTGIRSCGAYWGLSDYTNILMTETSSPIKTEVSKRSQTGIRYCGLSDWSKKVKFLPEDESFKYQ